LDADSKKKFQIYLPPSFMEATLLSGLDAPTTTTGNSDPVPVLLRIKELAILPNKVRGDLKGCFVLAEGKGNLASERVEVRLVTLSCVSKKGQSVIDQTVKGYVVDEDGKAGLRGIVSAKMGAMLARSALAGFLGGVGEAVQSSSMDFQTTAMGTQTQIWSDTDTKNMVKGGIGGGIAKSAEQLEKFYLQLAEQTLPIIQVGATKTVTVVISEGINLEVRDAAIIN
jgi:conjugal transfer pilus assembly protein TraB